MATEASWFSYHKDEHGTNLGEAAKQRIEKLLASGDLNPDEIAYISKVDLAVSRDVSHLDERSLERLRRMCMLWDLQLRPARIDSHRPIVGPIIVRVKKMLFSMLSVLLRDSFRQQREFNGAVIAAVVALAAQKEKRAETSAASIEKQY